MSLSQTHGFPAPTVPIPGLWSRPDGCTCRPDGAAPLPSRSVPPVTPRLQHGSERGEPRGVQRGQARLSRPKDPPR